MGKRITALLLLAVMLFAMWPTVVYAEKTVTDSGAVTRVEWLKELTETFGMTVEEDNYPDNYFSDVNPDSESYYTIMLAVEFGIIDVEAGEAVYPDNPATREFASHTLNYCLGFQMDEGVNYTYSDVEDTDYPEDVQVAVNRSWLQLIDGCFQPGIAITEEEMQTMLADARAVLDSAEIDENYENSYQFADYVVVFPEGTDVIVNEKDVVFITGAAQTVKQGDTFVVWPSELPSIYVAESVVISGDEMTITTSEADTSEAVLAVDSAGTVGVDLSQFEEAEGVSVIYVRNQEQARMAAQTYGISAGPNSVVATKDIKLGNGVKVSITCDLSNLSLHHKIDTQNHNFYATVSGTSTITGTTSFDAISAALGSSSVTLGSVRVAGVGKVTVSAELALNGKISATYQGDFEAGMQYSDRGGYRVVKSFVKKSFTTTAEANVSIGLKVSFGLDLLVLKGDIYATTGISAKITSNTYSDGKNPKNCTQMSAWLYVTVGAEARVGIDSWNKTWKKSVSVYNSGNSPVRLSFHYEDGRQVTVCARTGKSYVTPANSKYGTSSYGDTSSIGIDTGGNEMTIWSYTVKDENATITGYQGSAGMVAVPAVIDGYKVTAIGNSAFANNKSVTGISLPEGVTSVGNQAFSGCTALKSLTLPGSVTRLGYWFIENTAIESLTVPKSVTESGYGYHNASYSNGALANCKTLKTVTFEEGMLTIPAYICASQGYTSYITTVNLPSTITEIGNSAFSGCTGLTDVEFPSALSQIGNSAFSGCTSLPSLTLPKTVESIKDSAFSGCTGLGSITIEPSDKTGFKVTLGSSVFSGCTSLEEISLSGNVKSIGDSAFQGCTALKQVVLPEGVTSVGNQAFSGCTALKSLTLPGSVTRLGYWFIENTAIESLTVPKSVTESGYGYHNASYSNGALANCKTLKTVTFEEGMLTIPAYICASQGYTSYITTVNLPSTITEIGNSAFSGCTSLTDVNYGGTREEWNKITIGSGNDCLKEDIIRCHEHSFDKVVVTSPTCTEQGYTTYTCQICGYSYRDDYTEASGHTEVEDAGRDATCTEDGLTMGSHCSVCGVVMEKQQRIPATGHTLNTGTITVRATCTTDGIKTYTCGVCKGKTTEKIPAMGHDYSISEVTTPSTCVTEGILTYTCANCGEDKEEAIPTADHEYQSAVTKPTCTEKGYTTYTCETCEDSYKTAFKAALGHDFDEGVITTPATEDKEGIRTYTCKRCGGTKTESIPAIESQKHTYDKGTVTREATCTEAGEKTFRCTDCGYSYVEKLPALGHDFDEGVVTTPATEDKEGVRTYTCRRCGTTRTDGIPLHVHTYDDGTVISEPSCTEAGKKIFYCTDCGKSYEEELPAAGHDYQKEVTEAATCTEKGTAAITCAVCGDYYEETLSAHGHTFGEGKVTKEATCTEPGTRTYTCTECGKSYGEGIPAVWHDYEVKITEAGCTEKGYTSYTCSVCKDSYRTDYTDALGHIFPEEGEITKQATEEEEGEIVFTCERCEETKTGTIPVLGTCEHVYDEGVTTKEASCTESGIMTYTCSICGITRTESIPVLPHTYEAGETKEAACTEKGQIVHTCSVCGDQYMEGFPATGHVFDREEVIREVTCTEPGEKTVTCSKCEESREEELPATGHDYQEEITGATCTEKGYTTYTCGACGDTYRGAYTAACGHAFSEGVVTKEATCKQEGSKTYTCSTCGGTKTETVPKTTAHTYDTGKITKNPTCKEEGIKTYTCAACGKTKTEAIAKTTNHTYDTGKITKNPTCKEEGIKTYTCAACGKTKTEAIAKTTNHTYDTGKITKNPTCKEEGVKTYTCRICGATKTEAVARTIVHTFDEGKIIKKANCKEKGTRVYTCKVCGETKIETIPKTTAHTFDAGRITPKSTCKVNGVRTYTCTVCGKTKTEKLPKTAHSYKTTVKKATLKKDGKRTTVCTVCGNVKETTVIHRIKSVTLKKTSYSYDGKSKKPGITVKDAAGKIISSKNYKLSYDKGRKKIGIYKVKVTFKGDYSGTETLSFRIIPSTPKLSSVTAGSRKLTVKWKKGSRATGYELQYSTSKDFSKGAQNVIIKSGNTVKKTISGLKAKKTYYVRVRSYKTVSGKKYYSGWSSVKKAVTKK
ncbi:MAG: fibronectin type III domain-containing protein [Roseburia sp.]|nr:fibronectin type III domain-containing protein [Roseburia sp.]